MNAASFCFCSHTRTCDAWTRNIIHLHLADEYPCLRSQLRSTMLRKRELLMLLLKIPSFFCQWKNIDRHLIPRKSNRRIKFIVLSAEAMTTIWAFVQGAWWQTNTKWGSTKQSRWNISSGTAYVQINSLTAYVQINRYAYVLAKFFNWESEKSVRCRKR